VSWPLVCIGDCLEKVKGWNSLKSESREPFFYIDLSSVDKHKKIVDQSSVSKVLPSEAPSRARQIVKSNDVLVATVRPNLNGVALVPDEFDGATASTGYCVLRPNGNRLDSKYLYFWVQTRAFVTDMVEKATGATYPAVSDKIIKESKIPLPPLIEQKRIAAILDKADAIRRKRQLTIQLADDFLHAVFLELFGDPVTNVKGWKIRELGELIAENDRINYGIVQPGDHVDGGVPIVRVGDFHNGLIDKSNLKCVSPEIDEKHKKSRLHGDEILITCVGATIGKVALADSSLKGFNTVRAVTRVRLNKEVSRHYVYRYLQSPFVQKYFDMQSRTVGQPTLNGTQISKTPILIPDEVSQSKYLDIAIKIELLLKKTGCHNRNTLELFSSLSQKSFSEEL